MSQEERAILSQYAFWSPLLDADVDLKVAQFGAAGCDSCHGCSGCASCGQGGCNGCSGGGCGNCSA